MTDIKLKQITLDEFKKVNTDNFGPYALVYRAWIKKPADYFKKNFGINFWETIDNLDYVQVAFFSLDNGLVFLLSYYRRSPVPNITSIEVANNYSTEQVETIADALRNFFQLGLEEVVIPPR